MNEEEIPGELRAFLDEVLGGEWQATPLHGDASARRYFRIRTAEASLIAAHYPEQLLESVQRFVTSYDALRPHGRVPHIVRHSAAHILQNDVGDQTLFDVLHSDRARALALYRKAITLLLDFHQAPAEAQRINPPFDREKFASELQMTAEFYVEKLCGAAHSSELQTLFDRLAAELTTHPYLLCHRDYHGQNIHIVGDALFVIDYQDMRMGPDTYDLASLLRDRGAGEILGEEEEENLIEFYAQRTARPEGIRRRYFANLLQRSVKAIGTFARQAVERQRMHYLEFIPPTLRAVDRSLSELPEYDSLRRFFPMQYPRSQ